MWLVGVVVRRYIDILIIIINFPYSTCIRSFFGSSILTSLFIFKMFFRSYLLNFSASNNLTVTVWRNNRIVYVLSTLSQLADNMQVTRIASNKDGRE